MEEKKTLKQVREECGITKISVAKYLGISQRTLRRKEEENKFRVSEAIALCNLYHVSIDEVEV